MLYKAIKNNENIIKVIHNTKYVSTVTLDTYKLNLTKKVNAGIVKVTKVNLNAGAKAIYNTDEERRNAHNQQSLTSYHNNPLRVKYKKDTDKSLSSTHKKWIVDAYKALYGQYQFNFLITLQHGFVLDSWDKSKCKTSKDYQTIRNQDKYQIAKCYNEQQCLNEAIAYINRLKKNGKSIFDNWYLTIHKSRYDNSYHAHIAINIIDTSIVNIHTYLQNRWYKSQRKKQMVKKIHNQVELIGYMLEEKKKLNADTVYTDCNIDKFSNRLLNQDDITKDLNHSLNTYKHPTTISRLKQFVKAS